MNPSSTVNIYSLIHTFIILNIYSLISTFIILNIYSLIHTFMILIPVQVSLGI